MTGTIRHKPTRHSYEKGRGFSRANRTRVRASTYSDSARKRRDYRRSRLERHSIDLSYQADPPHRPPDTNGEFESEYISKWSEKINAWYEITAITDPPLYFDFDLEVATQRAINEQREQKEMTRRLIDLACTVGCNI